MLVTWNTITVNWWLNIHPNTWDYWNNNWEWIFIETWFSDWNGTFIWLLDNITIPTTPFDFQMVEKTEQEINDLLLTWYWADEQSNQYVTVSNYIFTDNRPLDI